MVLDLSSKDHSVLELLALSFGNPFQQLQPPDLSKHPVLYMATARGRAVAGNISRVVAQLVVLMAAWSTGLFSRLKLGDQM